MATDAQKTGLEAGPCLGLEASEKVAAPRGHSSLFGALSGVGRGLRKLPVFVSRVPYWGGLCCHGYKPQALLGDRAMVYTDTDPHGPARKIATDLLSHWPYIFIVSGKGRPAHQRLIILQRPVNCIDGVFKHPFRHQRRLLE